MAHAFFAILEREPDFLTLVDSAFSFSQPSFAGTGKTGIYKSNFDLRYFDRFLTAVQSLWRRHLLCLSFISTVKARLDIPLPHVCKICLSGRAIRRISSLQILHLGRR